MERCCRWLTSENHSFLLEILIIKWLFWMLFSSKKRPKQPCQACQPSYSQSLTSAFTGLSRQFWAQIHCIYCHVRHPLERDNRRAQSEANLRHRKGLTTLSVIKGLLQLFTAARRRFEPRTPGQKSDTLTTTLQPHPSYHCHMAPPVVGLRKLRCDSGPVSEGDVIITRAAR